MTLTFELAHFTVREGEEDELLAERPAMVRALQQAFPAALAAERIDAVPEAHSWFRHIAESHGLRHVEVVDEALFYSNSRP